ncbi:hypothetical protein PMAYCL1PPCAC_16462, partial [Pristionchus mayeri]
LLYCFALISVIANSLLIALILQRQCRLLGKYRWLLLTFAIGDIIISLFHAWTGLKQPAAFGFILNTVYCLLFYEPFILLSFHFIYRWVALEKFVSEGCDRNPMFIQHVSMQFRCENRCAITTTSIFEDHLQWGGVNWVILKAIGIDGIVATASLNVNAMCIYRIRKYLQSHTKMSDRTRNQQVQLFRALLWQFFVPFVLCFVPFNVCFVLPITGIAFNELGNIIGNMASMFPAVDAVMVMFIVGR